MSHICTRTIIPVYNALSTTLYDDVEGLAQLFVDMETAALERDVYFEVSTSHHGPLATRYRTHLHVLAF